MTHFLSIFPAFLMQILALPLDNGLLDEPELECGPVSIAMSFTTLNPFHGHVYVKGRFDEPGCRSDESGGETTGLSIPFSTCGILRERSLNPRGLFASATIIITFHPYFLTKVDRAFNVKCFYMEADKTVSTPISVSEITTSFINHNVPMPVCRYEILEGGSEGNPTMYALVGMQVYHKWICDSETTETFCMRVHSCFVEDGANRSVEYLDETGCAVDKYVLSDIEYISDLSAGQESHVYKFADRSQLLFKCQITITIKEPGIDCSRPACALQPRYRRSIITGRTGSIDVSRSLESLDIDITSFETLPFHKPALCIAPIDDHPYFIFTMAFSFILFMVVFAINRFRCRRISQAGAFGK